MLETNLGENKEQVKLINDNETEEVKLNSKQETGN